MVGKDNSTVFLMMYRYVEHTNRSTAELVIPFHDLESPSQSHLEIKTTPWEICHENHYRKLVKDDFAAEIVFSATRINSSNYAHLTSA